MPPYPLVSNASTRPVHAASDICAVVRLAEESDLTMVIHGGAEARRVAGSLADASVPLIFDPLDNLPRHFETLRATLEHPARLHAAGSTHNARNLTQAAGNAVAHGLPPDAALAALTREPAEIFGIDEDHGSLKEGKVADLVLWDGDPLEVTSYPDRVFIAGREILRETP